MGFRGGSDGKASACNAGDLGSIHRLGRPPGEGNGTPLQYSCLEDSTDGGIWWSAVPGVAKSRTRLSIFTCKSGRPVSETSTLPLLLPLLTLFPPSGYLPATPRSHSSCQNPITLQGPLSTLMPEIPQLAILRILVGQFLDTVVQNCICWASLVA